MKITKQNKFFRLFGMLTLAIVSGEILTGCTVVGGIIGYNNDHVFIGIIIGVIIDAIIFGIIGLKSGSSGGSSFNPGDWSKRRMNDPHTCGTCSKYLDRGVCRLDGSSKTAKDSCSNWD